MASTNDINLDPNSYIAFDALSIKQQIKNRLTKSGILTDQAFEGSNISEITDLVAFVFNVLMFYLNKTSNEAMFSNAQLYENMNQIVKLLDYKPVGFQTSTLTFKASAANLTSDLYTIPRYSFIGVGGIPFSFNEDITFAKLTNTVEELTELSKQKLFFQGKYVEYPLYTAVGNQNETVFLVVGDGVLVDHFNIDVYVKTAETGVWQEYKRTPSLFLEDAFAMKYEIRFNENQRYEIRFGDDINGKQLQEGDEVAIYYLQSLGTNGEVGAAALFGQRMFTFNSVQFTEILADIAANQYTFMSTEQLANLAFDNDSISTYSAVPETVSDIRKNSPGIFKSQYRLVTTSDYDTFVRTNFANLIQDVAVINNTTYLTENLKYYYDIGLTTPNRESRILYNQINFSDACNFNNVYVITVPKAVTNTSIFNNYLSPSQKQLIISSMESEKVLTADVIMIDPVYVAISVALEATITSKDTTVLQIIKDPTSRRDNGSIRNDVQGVFSKYFDRSVARLGQLIDINALTASLLTIPGVKTFYTSNEDNTNTHEGLSLLAYNPIYKNDVQLIFKNTKLPPFKYPYFVDLPDFANKIQIISENVFPSTIL